MRNVYFKRNSLSQWVMNGVPFTCLNNCKQYEKPKNTHWHKYLNHLTTNKHNYDNKIVDIFGCKRYNQIKSNSKTIKEFTKQENGQIVWADKPTCTSCNHKITFRSFDDHFERCNNESNAYWVTQVADDIHKYAGSSHFPLRCFLKPFVCFLIRFKIKNPTSLRNLNSSYVSDMTMLLTKNKLRITKLVDKTNRQAANDLESYVITKFENAPSTENLSKTGRRIFTDQEKAEFELIVGRAHHHHLDFTILNGLFNVVAESCPKFQNTIDKLYQDKEFKIGENKRLFLSALMQFEKNIYSHLGALPLKRYANFRLMN